ncbi:MAG: hypothetical protein ACK5YO_22675, partial [Planctomyces sp.]
MLGLVSPSYLHSRSIVVHSASDGVSPLVTALTSVLLGRVRLRTQKKPAPGPWKLRQRLGTATLVTSNLLILAASNVLFPLTSN